MPSPALLKFPERATATDHEVANDEQRPAIAKAFEREAHGTTGASLSTSTLEPTIRKVAEIGCKVQVIEKGKSFIAEARGL